MLKILIVDDEFYFRQYLKTCIDWESLDCQIIGEASDGEEGLKLLEELSPDLVLLDVNMPRIDGIEFSKKIFEEQKETVLVILSGHSEFQYAQKAMKYGVKSYLLKPLDEEELCLTVQELGKRVQEKKIYRKKLENLEKEQNSLLEETLVNELIHGRCSKNSLLDEYANFIVLALEILGNEWKQWTKEETDLWFYAVKNVVREIIPKRISMYFGWDAYGRMICILQHQKSFETLEDRIRVWAAKWTGFICKHFPFKMSAGIGSSVKESRKIQDSYKQAVFSLKNKFVINEEHVFAYGKAKTAVTSNTLINSEKRSKILIYLRQGDLKNEEKELMQIFQKGRLKSISYDMLQCHCTELIFLCLEYLEERELSVEKIFPNSSFPLQILERIHTFEDAETEIIAFYRTVFGYMKNMHNTKTQIQMEDIKEYIGDNFQNAELKIIDISNNFHLNYHYLCHSFKQQTGMTLNQYITWVRIEEAKKKIEEGICNLTLLAEQVGYSDLGYFGKCFKKQVGISPSRYLKQMTGTNKITNDHTFFTNKNI